ncbi:MAG TPA: type II toxin-antitoxin system VapC family toxin [Vicinamibacterales bacterium]|nr:type II toxin-antitoxin system VapC family toxin [Vicinamibacterales bacterium]
MNLLLDTQALLWWRHGDRKLGRRASRAIEADARQVWVSTVAVWEIAIKSRYGKLKLRDPLDAWLPEVLEQRGFHTLDVTIDHAVAVAHLPDHHADPFDRLLIAQAQLEDLTIVTSDAAFEAYDVKLLDARS